MRFRKFSRPLSSLIAGSLIITLGACGEETDSKSPRTLTIGIKYDQPGLSMMGKNGTPEGFDVEVATYVAEELGVDAEHITWAEARTPDREAQITGGEVDFTVATYSITNERKTKVGFAGPYFVAGQDLLVRSDNKDITRPETLGGKKLCSAKGSTSADRVRKDFAAGVRLALRPTYSACVDALLAGEVDAVTTDDVILAGYAKTHRGKVKVAGRPVSREYYGIGIKRSDTALQTEVTEAVKKMIADGSWQRALKKYIAPSGYELPKPPTLFLPTGGSGKSAKASKELTAEVHADLKLANAGDWKALERRSCKDFRPQLRASIAQLAPEFDQNLAAEVKGVKYRAEVLGVTQKDDTHGTVWGRSTYDNVPDKYRRYFKPIDWTADFDKGSGTWKFCGLSAVFDDKA
ncbi:glutamate ABC transporter substrate-binding protein [Streptomyces sp. T-3]|nr:glutamate ABC transporter substrate-binding protein [Streptomyces sp. T-3]